jgi:hypothetical protein
MGWWFQWGLKVKYLGSPTQSDDEGGVVNGEMQKDYAYCRFKPKDRRFHLEFNSW